MTLTEFLLTRIAVDEDGRARALRDLAEVLRGQGYGLAADHLERESARVLAECEAKRRIMEEHRPGGEDGKRYCGCCWLDDLEVWEPYPCPTMKALALPYADHPDFREEWRP